jgi:multiple sugar transport system permease protein
MSTVSTRNGIERGGQKTTLQYPPPGAVPPLHRRRHPERWLAHAGLLLVCVGFILPFAWMLSTSLKPLERVQETGFIPDQVKLWKYQGVTTPIPQNYVDVVASPKLDFARLTRNTLIIAVMSVVGTLVSSSLVAYAFAKIRFTGRGVLFGIMLATMMIPFPVTMVSLFAIFRWLGEHTGVQFLGTLRPLWIGAWFGSAFNIFMLRQFYMTIPEELSEAARIDGCSEFGIYWRVILPLAKPALIVVGLFTFMGAWNDFLGPLIYIQDPAQYTLALGLQAFQSQQGGTEWNLLMAASLLVILPVIILFFMAQRTFVQGIATTGIKG